MRGCSARVGEPASDRLDRLQGMLETIGGACSPLMASKESRDAHRGQNAARGVRRAG